MPAITPGTPQHFVVDVFRKTLADVLSQALGSSWSVEIGTEEVPPPQDPALLSFGLTASGRLQGNAAFQLPHADAVTLAQKLFKNAPDPGAELNADRKKAIEDLLRQVSDAAATALQSPYEGLSLQLSSIDPPAWSATTIALIAAEASGASFTVHFKLATELVNMISAAVSATAPLPTPPSSTDSNLDLLLGVDLSLTLRFGQRTLTLREILDLTSGSVIELDRQVQEPADLLLGDKLIARGEVVIVDGNYGLRVTEVADASHTGAMAGAAANR